MSNLTTQRANIQTITQSLSVGVLTDTTGSAFNDARDVGSWPVNLNIDPTHPFLTIQVQFRKTSSYIDGLTVTYQLLDDGSGKIGPSSPIQHGSKYTGGANDSNKVVNFDTNEILLAVAGRAGSDGTTAAIRELTILKFDTQSGAITTNTFGSNDSTAPFYASGPILALAGTEDNSSTRIGLKTLSFISSRTLSSNSFQINAEQVVDYNTYEDASKASCKFVDQGKKKIQPSDLVLYECSLPASPAYGKIVGVGVKTPAQVVVAVVRLDMDNSGKGIHFNAVSQSDASQKLAACLKWTKGMTADARTDLYMQYIHALENRSPTFIWDWWRLGMPVGNMADNSNGNVVAANANIISGFIASGVNVNTTDGHSGTGAAVGVGAGLDVTAGALYYNSWDTLKSQVNVITIVAELDALNITFIVDGAVAGVFLGVGIGEVTFEGAGWLGWS